MQLFHRNRRLRTNESIRSLVRETQLTTNDLVLPVFVIEGTKVKEPVAAMPGVFRYSLDMLLKELEQVYDLGVRAINIYVKVDESLKDNTGKEAWNPEGLMQQTLRAVKKHLPQMILMPDVALDPYSIYGHDGIISQGRVINDATNEALAKMAVSQAQAGADFVAPSDMMDGRCAVIREALDANGHHNVGILSYAAKYASAFYGPFRTALDSAPVLQDEVPEDKKTYQMDTANTREAIREVLCDVEEGADIIMIKPGMPNLDIIARVREIITHPIAVYQVSGEYAMIKSAAQNGWLDNDKVLLESLLSIKRAGADMIFTYAAKEVATLLSKI